jgi:hypothetical protein
MGIFNIVLSAFFLIAVIFAIKQLKKIDDINDKMTQIIDILKNKKNL